MKLQNIVHSDQIVATLAKMPMSTFGSPCTKETAIVLARHMNKAHDWAACLYLRSIAKAIGCTTRTVRNALRRLEALGFIKTEHRKHDQIESWNLASVFRMGAALRSLFNQSFRTPGKPDPARSSISTNQKQSDRDRARASLSGGSKPKRTSPEPVVRSPDEWAAREQAGIDHNKTVLQKLINRLRG